MNNVGQGLIDFLLDLVAMIGVHKFMDKKERSNAKTNTSDSAADDDSKSGKHTLPAWMTSADEKIFADLLRKLKDLLGDEVIDDSIGWYKWLKKVHKVRKAVLLRHLVYKMETDQEQIEFLSMFILIIQTRQESDYQRAVDMLDYVNSSSSEDILDRAGEWFKGPGAIYFTSNYYLDKLEAVVGRILDKEKLIKRREKIVNEFLPKTHNELRGKVHTTTRNFLLGKPRIINLGFIKFTIRP